MAELSNEIRIFGPPGTGKTTKIAELIQEEARTVGSEAVIASSFTKTAAKELAARHLPMDKQQIGTLHSLAFHHLGCPTVLEKDPALDEWNARYPYWAFRDGKVPDVDDPYGDSCTDDNETYQDYQRSRARQLPPETWNPLTVAFAEKWQEFKDQRGLVDFTDLIEQCLSDATPPLNAAVGFFDEVQDFSPLELALVRKWATGMERCYLAGDDDQCIYHFKGATPDAFLFPEIPAGQKILLSKSYRLPEAIHSLATNWASSIHPREEKPYYPRSAVGIVQRCADDYQSPEMFYGRLQDDLQAYRSVMVLGSCKYMLDPLVQFLRELGIPFHNPFRPGEGKWNPLRFSDSSVTAGARVLAFHRLHERFQHRDTQPYTYRELWAWAEGTSAKLWKRGAKTGRNGMKQFADEAGGAEMAGPQFVDWLESAAIMEALLDGDPRWLLDVGTQKAQKQLRFAVHVARRQGVEALQERPKLIIGNIHSVKGGQADCVWLFPDMSPRADEEWCAFGEGRMAMKRTFYVGLTRAKEKLVLCEPASDRHMWG